MKRKFIVITSLFFLLFSSEIIAQIVLLDSITLDTLTAFTSIDEAMKHPYNVVKLELRKNKLKKFPKEILNFPNLQYLDLSKNNIEDIPHEIGELKNLQYLSLNKNKLQDLPIEIGQLTNLYYLNISQNDMAVLPNTIGNLVNLKNLDMWSNNVDTFPDEMKNMKSLQVLDLRVIMIPDREQARLQKLLPETKIEFTPYCKCQQ